MLQMIDNLRYYNILSYNILLDR